MLQPRIRSSSRAVFDISSTATPLSTLAAAFNSLALCPKHSSLLPRTTIRNASHAAQGRANGPKDSAGRRLGAKKTSTQYVIPGNIIFKQRGTKWFPGENVGMGKDHTIYATVAGYVRYYRNPTQHPKRRYIGVALEKEGPGSVLPTPHNAPTRRRLGMYATPMARPNETDTEFLENHLSGNSKPPISSIATATEQGNKKPGEVLVKTAVLSTQGVKSQPWKVVMKPGTVWESNYELGRAAEKKGITAREFDRKDRWLAWRKRSKKVQEKLLARAAKATRKTSGKKSNKGTVTGVRK